MPLASGLGSQFGLALETTYGTVVTPNKFYEFDSESLNLDPTYQEGVGLRAGRIVQPASRTIMTTRQAGGQVPMDVPNKLFGSIVNLMHGLTVTPVQQAATAAYKQTHSIGTSQPNKSATLQFNKPQANATDLPFTYPGSVLQSVGFSIDVGGLLKASLSFDAQDELTPATTPAGPALAVASYPAGLSAWNHTQGIVTMDGANVGRARSCGLTWTQPYKDDEFFLGSGGTKQKPIPNGFATVEGTMGLEFYDSTAYSLWRTGRSNIAVIFDFQGPIIASTFKEQITFTMSSVQLRGESPQVGGPDVIDVNVPFRALDDGTNPPLKIEYTSTDITI